MRNFISFQFQVIARDPLGQFAIASVTVNVIYDSPPIFDMVEYNVTIPETLALNSEVFPMIARDPDDLTSVSTSLDITFFY